MKIIFHLQFVSELLQCTLFSRSDQTNKQTKKCVFSDSVVPFFLNISLYQSYCVCFYFTDFLIVMSWNLGLSIQHQYYYQVLKKVDETTVQSRALTRVTIQKIKFFCGCYYSRHVTNRDVLLFIDSKILDFEIKVSNMGHSMQTIDISSIT